MVLEFQYDKPELHLTRFAREDGRELLHRSESNSIANSIGNPLAIYIGHGSFAGAYGMDTFQVEDLSYDDRSLLAYLKHSTMPLVAAIQIEVEGSVVTWRAQVGWNGNEELDAEIYFPLFSKLRFASPEQDRAIVPGVSGAVFTPLSSVDFQGGYLGGLSSPTFLVEGGGHGVAFLDENRADLAADPGACVRRTYIVRHDIPDLTASQSGEVDPAGTYAGVCHGRKFRSTSDIGLTDADMAAELRNGLPLAMSLRGDAVDLGPISTYGYEGEWRVGASWLRSRRKCVPFRVPPAQWFRDTTSISEDLGDAMLGRGQSFYDYPAMLTKKRQLGSDVFHLPGFHDPEILGQSRNWQNRGDYYFAGQNLGGFEAARAGIDAVHRQGGHILYYVEGLIMWKRSRIGRSRGREWALMREDGTYDTHYEGFWHMCPAVAEWRDWLANTCADIVRSTGVDGFFIDSSCATHFHRCFNPAHNHTHPDVWDWGLRQMLRRVREELDKVNPETVILVEGAGDIAREYVDGFLTHSHDWTRGKFNLPYVRFLHPEMRVYESWGGSAADPTRWGSSVEAQQVWNFVTGHRNYAHTPQSEKMAVMSTRTRRYHDMFPEVCQAPLSARDVTATGCITMLFESEPIVITIGNPTGASVAATLDLPTVGTILFDRCDGLRLPMKGGRFSVELAPWDFRAFEVRA